MGSPLTLWHIVFHESARNVLGTSLLLSPRAFFTREKTVPKTSPVPFFGLYMDLVYTENMLILVILGTSSRVLYMTRRSFAFCGACQSDRDSTRLIRNILFKRVGRNAYRHQLPSIARSQDDRTHVRVTTSTSARVATTTHARVTTTKNERVVTTTSVLVTRTTYVRVTTTTDVRITVQLQLQLHSYV